MGLGGSNSPLSASQASFMPRWLRDSDGKAPRSAALATSFMNRSPTRTRSDNSPDGAPPTGYRTFGRMSSFSLLRSTIVFAVGTPLNGGQSNGSVKPASL